MEWKKVKLEHIVDTTSGGTPNRSIPSYWNGNIPWLKSGELNDAFLESAEEFISEEGLKNSSAKLFSKGTLLLALYGATAGKLGILNFDSATNQALCAISPKNKNLYNKFLLYFLLSERENIIKDSVGGAQPNISQSYVRNIAIPLPPLPTQQRIAAILDEADALRKADAQLLAKYDELLQASFLELFGDPVRNEKKWEAKQAAEILIDIVAGTSYGGEEKELSDDELGVLKISAVTQGFFKSDEYKAVKKIYINKELVSPRKGDLIFSRANTRELVGATCIVDKDYPNLFLPDKLWRLDFNREKCNQYYFKTLLSHEEFRVTLTKTATGTSGSMLNISMDKLKNLVIPLPPIKLQNRFASIVAGIEEQKVIATQQLKQSEALFQSLLQRAFKGEL